MTTRVLTGITTSGTPHLGNFVGAVRPAIASSRAPDTESFFFLADLHSLVKVQDAARVQRSTLEIAATWLAAGLDPAQVWFYRQSDVPETSELMWFLTCVAGKGVLNRAHAYKAAVDRNRADAQDDDAGISAGLFMYPVLMAADILLFNAHRVPVGRDQVQHIEMARDFAQRFNHLFGGEHFVLPQAVIDDNVATLPGLDGRKMSKSYDNTIPLFAPREELRRLVNGMLTDSRAPGEPRQAEGSNVFQLYQAFASADETAQMRQAFDEGIGWGDAKQKLFERIDAEVAPMREQYERLLERPVEIEEILRDQAARLREKYAIPRMANLRMSVGLRDLSLRIAKASTTVALGASPRALPQFKQYRERDGRFYFKLIDGQGRRLLQSEGFESPKEAGQLIGRLKRDDSADLAELTEVALHAPADEVRVALQRLREADA